MKNVKEVIPEVRTCPGCGSGFAPRAASQRFCPGSRCRYRFHNERSRRALALLESIKGDLEKLLRKAQEATELLPKE